MARTGDARERQAKARRARAVGRSPSEAQVTTGAAKQRTSLGGREAAKANRRRHEEKGKS